MTKASYSLTAPLGTEATLGLIVLQTDETIEHDFRQIFHRPDVAIYVSRIANSVEVNPSTLAAMAQSLPNSAALLPPSLAFDAVGYACTSGATLIGSDRVGDLVRSAVNTKSVSDPLSAAIASFSALGVTRIGLVTPYIESVSASMRDKFRCAGIDIAAFVSFEEGDDSRVARISAESIYAAGLEIGKSRDVEAVFLSCTNLRTLGVIDRLELELGKPVVSSNQALAWHLARSSGLRTTDGEFGRIMRMR